jgi:hypothetical protein
MTGDLVPHTTDVPRVKGGTALAQFGGEDPFQIAFRPAAAVLDTVVALRKPLMWLDRQRQVNGRLPLLSLSRASEHRGAAIERCEVIPKDPDLYRAMRLFESAECEPAPEGEGWVHFAIGVMLDSAPTPADVHDAYRCAIVDGAYRDPELWGDYEPGFSAPVIVRSVREARLQAALPSAGSFLKMCVRHRAWFGRSRMSIWDLIEIRQNAEDVLTKLGDDRVADLCFHEDDEDWDFGE